MLTPWIPSLWQLGPPGPSKEAGCLQSPQEGGFTLEWLGWTDAGETLMGNVLLSQCVSQSSSHLAWYVAEIHNAVILLLFPMLTLPTRLHLIPLSSDRVGQNLQYKYPWQELCPLHGPSCVPRVYFGTISPTPSSCQHSQLLQDLSSAQGAQARLSRTW